MRHSKFVCIAIELPVRGHSCLFSLGCFKTRPVTWHRNLATFRLCQPMTQYNVYHKNPPCWFFVENHWEMRLVLWLWRRSINNGEQAGSFAPFKHKRDSSILYLSLVFIPMCPNVLPLMHAVRQMGHSCRGCHSRAHCHWCPLVSLHRIVNCRQREGIIRGKRGGEAVMRFDISVHRPSWNACLHLFWCTTFTQYLYYLNMGLCLFDCQHSGCKKCTRLCPNDFSYRY